MAGYKWDRFGGLRPLASLLRLGPNEAVQAQNVDLRRGFLRPLDVQASWNSAIHPSLLLADLDDVPMTLYRFRDRVTPANHLWMYWTTDVDVAKGPLEDDHQRHYYTGDGVPKLFTKDSIDDATPSYPEAADTKYPMTWFRLGVPAPVNGSGAVVPLVVDETSYVEPGMARTGAITGLVMSNLMIRFQPKRAHRFNDIYNSRTNGLAIAGVQAGTTHMDSADGAQPLQALRPGSRVKVTEVIDVDHVRVSGVHGTGHLEKFGTNYDNPVPENRLDERWSWDDDETITSIYEDPFHGAKTLLRSVVLRVYIKINGKDNDICWTYHVPDGAVLTVPGHTLRVNDVIRVIASSMAVNTATRMLAGAPIVAFGDESGRQRSFTVPGQASITFAGNTTYFIERNGAEIDPTLEGLQPSTAEPTTRSYVYTYLTAFGEEGPPNKPTEPPITIALNDSVVLRGFIAPPTDHRNITHYRLYRTSTGTNETAFLLVEDILISAYDDVVGYLDDTPEDELSDVLPSETWIEPPADMLGVVAMPNEFLAGFFENVLCFSEPAQPHAWPEAYRMKLDVKVVGIEVVGGSLVVATEGTPYVVAGTHPRQMAARRVEEPSPCVDKRSMVDCGEVVVYASTDGLIAASTTSLTNITEEYFTHEQWMQVVGPVGSTGTVRAWYVDGEYLLRTSWTLPNGDGNHTEYTFDFRGGGRLDITTYSNPKGVWQAAFTDPNDGELYYTVGREFAGAGFFLIGALPAMSLPLFRWRYLQPLVVPTDPENLQLPAVYRSGRLLLPRPMTISVVKVLCRRIRNDLGRAISAGATSSFGRVEFGLTGVRYDGPDADVILEYLNAPLCDVVLIDGDSYAVNWPGEQAAKPFRLAKNVLVDALDFRLVFYGTVQIESIYVAESYDDLTDLDKPKTPQRRTTDAK